MHSKLYTLLLLLVALCYGPTASADHLSSNLQLTARLNGANEVPAVMTDAQGVGIFTLNADRNQISIDVSVSGLSGSITGIHIHEGAVGTNGGVVFDLSSGINGNRVRMQLKDFTAAQLATFINGGYYLNVHTEQNPAGEIRGQVLLESDFSYVAMLSGDAEVPAVTTLASGMGVFALSKSGYKLDINVVFNGILSGVTGAHLHQGGPNENGDVVENLTDFIVDGNRIIATVDPTEYLDALRSGNIYLNIHSAVNPGGEIRGQLLLPEGLQFDAVLTGGQEVPAVSVDGYGVAAMQYDPATGMMSVNAMTTDLTGLITGAHLHLGGLGSNGDVVVNLTDFIVDNSISTALELNADLLNTMLRGGVYLNIHTAANPGGEIRGQVYRLAREGYRYEFSGGQEVPPTPSMGTGAGMVTIDRNQTNAHFMMVVSGLDEAIAAAHFHNAVVGENGDVVFNITPFLNAEGGAYGYWTDADEDNPFTTQNSVMFRNNAVYVNVHTATFPNGAIRANVIRGRTLTSASIPVDPNFSGKLMLATKLSGAAEVPAVDTDGQGVASISISRDFTVATINVSVNNLSGPVMGIHIHEGAPDANGPVIFDLTPNLVGNRVHATLTDFTDEQLEKMLSGAYYLNAHTQEHPGGEIRGQLTLEAEMTFAGGLQGENEVPAVATDGAGIVTVHFTPVLGQLHIRAHVAGLSGPITGAHFHQAPEGENGDVVEDLTGFVNGNRIEATLSAGDYLEALMAGNIYLNIHTDMNPAGEIRAQLERQEGFSFDGFLNGSQEVPAVATAGSGMVYTFLSYDLSTMTTAVVYDDLSGELTGAHFHVADPGNNGDVVYNLIEAGEFLTPNLLFVEDVTLSDVDLVQRLLTGSVYVNMHTPGFAGGEIRGQLYGVHREGYGYDLCTDQEVHAVDAPEATGGGMFSVDRNLSNAHMMVVTSGLTGEITGAHLHEAPLGEDGPVVFDLTDRFADDAMFTYFTLEAADSIAQKVQAGNIYVNVHTEQHPAGELRGQIVDNLACELVLNNREVQEAFSTIQAFPNPATTAVRIHYTTNTSADLNVRVFDQMGRLIWERNNVQSVIGEQQFDLPILNWTSGIYTVQLQNGFEIGEVRVIKP